eukprot:763129-Hanusia_phi.AAC.8
MPTLTKSNSLGPRLEVCSAELLGSHILVSLLTGGSEGMTGINTKRVYLIVPATDERIAVQVRKQGTESPPADDARRLLSTNV